MGFGDGAGRRTGEDGGWTSKAFSAVRRQAARQWRPACAGVGDTGGNASQAPEVDIDVEEDGSRWTAKGTLLHPNWRARDWAERPVRFVDGKDVGQTVACLNSPSGTIIPVRLSEIGSIVMSVRDGELKREFVAVERVVSMVASAFPWEEMEALASQLSSHNFRLLAARPPGGELSDVIEDMRKAAQNRSLDEMEVLEELAVAQDPETPSVVDGRLERRSGGLNPERHSPVFGVIKTHRKVYLHSQGMRLLYRLAPGERTPAFFIQESDESEEPRGGAHADQDNAVRQGPDTSGVSERADSTPQAAAQKIAVRFPVVSWYVRLSGGERTTPDWGLVRVEASLKWFLARGYGSREQVSQSGSDFINRLSRTLYEYRCRQADYERAAVSLHPIVRAESSLGSLFSPGGMLRSRFYRLTGL
jgi:hypothetical protein